MSEIQDKIETTHVDVRRYMPGVGKRLLFNYAILMLGTLFLNIAVITLLLRFIPRPTANAIAFAINLIWLINGWRYLERRNHATALFVLYTRYSRERRDLTRLLDSEETPPLDRQIEGVEETAHRFIETAQAQQIAPQDTA